MNQINWKQKLTSRKFISALLGFIVPVLLAFGVSQSDITQVTSIVIAGITLISYILGESMVDSSRNNVDESAIGQITSPENKESEE